MFNINKNLEIREYECKQCKNLLLKYGSFELASPNFKELKIINAYKDNYQLHELYHRDSKIGRIGVDADVQCRTCGHKAVYRVIFQGYIDYMRAVREKINSMN